MELLTVLIYGAAGSGKGTQASLLRDYLTSKDSEHETLHVITGDMFRAAAEQETYTGELIRGVLQQGGLQPAFLPIWLWASYFASHLKGKEHVLVDGFPRRPEEAIIFDSAMRFYGRKNPVVIVLDVADEELLRRALEVRKRADDSEELMRNRIAWYRDEVVPTIGYFRNNPNYTVYDVNGARSIEEIHLDIRGRLGLV